MGALIIFTKVKIVLACQHWEITLIFPYPMKILVGLQQLAAKNNFQFQPFIILVCLLVRMFFFCQVVTFVV